MTKITIYSIHQWKISMDDSRRFCLFFSESVSFFHPHVFVGGYKKWSFTHQGRGMGRLEVPKIQEQQVAFLKRQTQFCQKKTPLTNSASKKIDECINLKQKHPFGLLVKRNASVWVGTSIGHGRVMFQPRRLSVQHVWFMRVMVRPTITTILNTPLYNIYNAININKQCILKMRGKQQPSNQNRSL